MVRKNIIVKMFMNTSFHYHPSLTQERYWSVVAWKRSVVLFEDRRDICFFPRMRKIPLVKGTIENNRKKDRQVYQHLLSEGGDLLDQAQRLLTH